MGSHNYLDYAATPSSLFLENTLSHIGTCSSRVELGTQTSQIELERLLAEYLRVEATLTFGMEFASNIGVLVDRHCLIMSDEMNNASLVVGARLSGAQVQTFKHNDVQDLEMKMRCALVNGHTVTRRAWKKILILVEGIYR